jgi:hypothetical protein
MPLRLKVWQKISGEWKTGHLDRLTTEISLDELGMHIQHMLQGKQKGRVIVNLQ